MNIVDVDQRLKRVETLLTELYAHLGLPDPGLRPGPGLPPGVAELVAAGKTIEAIKAYREATGADLADAKAAVTGH